MLQRWLALPYRSYCLRLAALSHSYFNPLYCRGNLKQAASYCHSPAPNHPILLNLPPFCLAHPQNEGYLKHSTGRSLGKSSKPNGFRYEAEGCRQYGNTARQTHAVAKVALLYGTKKRLPENEHAGFCEANFSGSLLSYGKV